MLPNYPNMTPSSAPYPHQSTRSDPSNTNLCKPVAIISHNSELTLVTCLQTKKAQNNSFICQHQEQRSNVSSIPRASLIQDLQRQSCCVYTINPDGSSVQEPAAGSGASVTPLAELKLEDLTEFMEIDETSFNQSTLNDLDSHKVNEEAMQELLSSKETASELSFSQQDASTSSASLNQGASTSGQASAASLTRSPINSALTQEKIIQISSLIPYEKRMIYCVLEILELNKEKSFTKRALIDLMKKKYTNFNSAQSVTSYNRAFACATNLDLIQKSRHAANATTVIYLLGQYGSAAFQYLKQEVSPTLRLKHSAASHSTTDTLNK